MSSLSTYRTFLEVVIVTDHADQLRAVLEAWEDLPKNVEAVQAQDDPADGDRYKLLWAHRSVMRDAYETGKQ